MLEQLFSGKYGIGIQKTKDYEEHEACCNIDEVLIFSH